MRHSVAIGRSLLRRSGELCVLRRLVCLLLEIESLLLQIESPHFRSRGDRCGCYIPQVYYRISGPEPAPYEEGFNNRNSNMSILTHVAVLSIYVLLLKANGKNPQPSVMLTNELSAHLLTMIRFHLFRHYWSHLPCSSRLSTAVQSNCCG